MSAVERELQRIAVELEEHGFAQTTFDRLGLDFDHEAAGRISSTCENKSSGEEALKLTEHVPKDGMIIVQDKACIRDGQAFVRPVVDVLFRDSPRARASWSLYGLNRYETGGFFGEHQDSTGATVLIVSVTGRRELTVGVGSAAQRVAMAPGDITLLDAQHDPVHTVRCTEGPSISAVLDVPDMLRSSYR